MFDHSSYSGNTGSWLLLFERVELDPGVKSGVSRALLSISPNNYIRQPRPDHEQDLAIHHYIADLLCQFRTGGILGRYLTLVRNRRLFLSTVLRFHDLWLFLEW